MQFHRLTCLLLVLISLIKLQVHAQEASPCPRIFTYEPQGPQRDRWYGIITLLHETELKGIWLRVIFDKPILQLGNWFGQVVKKSPTDYLVKNPDFFLKARTPHIVRLFVRFREGEQPPKLMEFRLNARAVCPEELLTTTPSTTTEQLFTSAAEDEAAGVGPAYVEVSTRVTPLATTTQKAYISGPNRGTEQPLRLGHLDNHNLADICGTTAPQQRHDRYGKQVAHKGEFPWHAMLYYTKDISIAYLCGASLISRLHLVTVAHCVINTESQLPINMDRLVVYLGKYYVKNWSHQGSQTRYVADITPHPKYNAQTYDNDIAVIKLFGPVDFTDLVRPVCLWKDLSEPGNKPGTIVGWGFDQKGRIEEKLMYVHMVMQEAGVCSRSVGSYYRRLTSAKTYCANFIDDSVECVGDSGGGMVYPTGAISKGGPVWQLRGLVTISVVLQHQLKCDRNHSVVFTDVSKYHEWLRECTNLT